MAANHQISVTLPEQLAALIQRKIASGEYADESDVICDSLLFLDDQENGLDRWLNEVAGPSLDAMQADPSRGLPLEQVQREFAHRRGNQSG